MSTTPAAPTGAAARRWSESRVRLAIVAFVVTLTLLGALGAGTALAVDGSMAVSVMPGVTIGGVDVGGLERVAAEQRLVEALPDLSAGTFTLVINGQEKRIPYAAAERGFEIAAALDGAMAMGRAAGVLERLARRLGIAVQPVDVPVGVAYDAAALDAALAEATVGGEQAVRDASVRATEGAWSVVEGRAGMTIELATARVQAHSAFAGRDPAPVTVNAGVIRVEPAITTAEAQWAVDRATAMVGAGLVLSDTETSLPLAASDLRSWIRVGVDDSGGMGVTVDVAAVEAGLTGIAGSVERAAADAGFAFGPQDAEGASSGVVAVPGVAGRVLDTAASAASVVAALEARAASWETGSGESVPAPAPVLLSFASVEPQFTTAQAQAAAPNVVRVSRWTTRFVPGENNFFGANISVPASKIDGRVVPVGRWFDFWKAIGELSRKEGYGPGAAIINGRTEPTGILAGGICSCSTTIFNAALRAGLEMGERRNHYYYISRYPVGLDATVFKSSSGSVQSMRFRNDTEYPLLIRALNRTGVVRFEIYTVPTGRTVTFSEPRIVDRQSAGDTLEYTDALAAGVTRRIQYPTEGFRVWVNRTVTDASGAVIHEDEFYSRYSAVDGITLVGRRPTDPPAGTVVEL